MYLPHTCIYLCPLVVWTKQLLLTGFKGLQGFVHYGNHVQPQCVQSQQHLQQDRRRREREREGGGGRGRGEGAGEGGGRREGGGGEKAVYASTDGTYTYSGVRVTGVPLAWYIHIQWCEGHWCTSGM